MKNSLLLQVLLTVAPLVAFSQPRGLIKKENAIQLEHLGTYSSGILAQGAAEIAAYDGGSQRLFVINAQQQTVDILDIAIPSAPTLLKKLNVGGGPNSVDVFDGLVAVAVEAEPKQNPGWVGFYDVDGNFLQKVDVGALPDMITFTRNGEYVLTANEGEPNDTYTVDPLGTVSIIKVSDFSVRTVTFESLNGYRTELISNGIRIFGPNASVAQDFEPEYITTSRDNSRAWVTLQENNAIATIDIHSATLLNVMPLGFKDHRLVSNKLDVSDRDNNINITNWPIKGMYMPDAIASYSFKGNDYLVTANEGDARAYNGFSEEVRVGASDYVLDPTAFPNAADLKRNANLGRLTVTNTLGDKDGDGDFDEIYCFGGRSFSIWSPSGELVFDSGDQFEQITAQFNPVNFNCNNNANNSFDTRSDDKGPEPEALAIGKVKGTVYAFVGLERIGGVMVYDITVPQEPRFVSYVNNRNFSGDVVAGTAGDLGPEALLLISEEESPIGEALLVSANEISGTTSIFRVVTDKPQDNTQTLSINVYPNPVAETLNIRVEGSFNILSAHLAGIVNGKSYLFTSGEIQSDGGVVSIPASHVASGLYVLELLDGSDVKRFTIQKQ